MLLALVPARVAAQARPQRAVAAGASSSSTAGGAAGAGVLYEEAAEYTRRKFAEFEKARTPFDQKLAARTKQEQRDLALRNAATLAARGPLRGTDLYFLGLLYNLADKPEGARDAMRRFLAENPSAAADLAQNARRVQILQAVRLNLLEEAAKVLDDYARAEPQRANERYALENALAVAYYKKEQFDRAAPHALESYRAAKISQAAAADRRQRDQIIFNAALLVAETYTRSKKRAEAVATMRGVLRLGLSYPSAELYSNAARTLERYG
ncbi:MAG: hypothetical protein ACRD68_08675, partial [Pyrinomonadaceae bacterium]